MLHNRLRSRKIIPLGAVVAVLALSQPACAATTVRLNLDQLTAMADEVALGHVLYSFARLDGETNAVFTETHIAVDRYLKSSGVVGFATPYVAVRQPGGKLAPYAYEVPGTASFQKNEWVVVFLKRAKGGSYRLVGWEQGKFRVAPNVTGTATVQGSAAALPPEIGSLKVEEPATEDANKKSGISLESFERRVRGLAAIHRVFPRNQLD